MHKINAIFVKYAYPVFPMGVMPFFWFWGYFVLDISLSLPAWFRNNWYWPMPIWIVIFIIVGKYFAVMKRKRIRQEVENFNKTFSSTGISMELNLHERSLTQLEVKLTVKMNIPTRQRFCQNSGISFHTPPTYNFDFLQSENRTDTFNLSNPSVHYYNGMSSVQIEQPPPYNISGMDQPPNYEEAAPIRKY